MDCKRIMIGSIGCTKLLKERLFLVSLISMLKKWERIKELIVQEAIRLIMVVNGKLLMMTLAILVLLVKERLNK